MLLHHPLHGLRKLSVSHVRIAYRVEVATHEVWILGAAVPNP